MPLFHSLEKKLLASGEQAKALIVTSEPTHRVVERGAIEQLVKRQWKLSLQVQPSAGPEFQVEVKQLLGSWRMPWRGETTDVLYNPQDHTQAILDPRIEGPTPPEWLWNPSTGTSPVKARRATEEAQNAPPEHQADLELLAHFYSDGALYDFEYAELRRRILGLPLVDPRPSIARALGPQAAGAYVRSAVDGHEIPLTSSDAPATPDLNDRISKLEALANRRDSGALSEAEFEAEKQQLLAGDRP